MCSLSVSQMFRGHVSTLLHRIFVALLISKSSKNCASLTILLQCNSLTNKEASTVLCSVVKHLGSDRARKKCRGKHGT